METNGGLALIVVLTLLRAAGTAGDITCTAATSRIQTSVTCHFGEDIGKSKHTFKVLFHYPEISNHPETPLLCTFAQSGELICQLLPNVTFDREVSDQITLTLPPSEDKVGGKFVCQVVPSLSDVPPKPCDLMFVDKPTTGPTESDTKKSDTRESSSSAAEDASETALYVKAIFFFMLIALVLCMVLCAVAFFLRDRIRTWCLEPLRSPVAERRHSVEAPAREEEAKEDSSPKGATTKQESSAEIIPLTASVVEEVQGATGEPEGDQQTPQPFSEFKPEEEERPKQPIAMRAFARWLFPSAREGEKLTGESPEERPKGATSSTANTGPGSSLLPQAGLQESTEEEDLTGKGKKGGKKKKGKK